MQRPMSYQLYYSKLSRRESIISESLQKTLTHKLMFISFNMFIICLFASLGMMT